MGGRDRSTGSFYKEDKLLGYFDLVLLKKWKQERGKEIIRK